MPTSPPSACCPHLQRRQCCELMAGFLHLQDCPHAIGVACFVATAVCPGAACCPPPSKPFFSCCFLLLGSHSPCTRHVSGGSGTARHTASAESTAPSSHTTRRVDQIFTFSLALVGAGSRARRAEPGRAAALLLALLHAPLAFGALLPLALLLASLD